MLNKCKRKRCDTGWRWRFWSGTILESFVRGKRRLSVKTMSGHKSPIDKLTPLLLLTMLCVSCVSHERAKLLFVRERDFDKGRLIDVVRVPPPARVEPINERTSRYIYEFKDGGCRWFYVVDNKTHTVISWQYMSDPNLCFMELKYGGAW